MSDDDDISYNTYLSRKLNRFSSRIYRKKQKKLPSTDDSEDTSKSKNDKNNNNNSNNNSNNNNFNNNNKTQDIKESKTDNNLNNNINNNNETDLYLVYDYLYKSKCRLDLKKLSLKNTKIAIPTPPAPPRLKKVNTKKAENNDQNNSSNNNNNNKIISSDYYSEKPYAYIKRFPTNNDHLVYVKDKIYNIYNIKTGEKIRTQRTNDISGYQGVLPLPRERILAVGADFLRIYHYNLYKKELKFVEPNNNYPNYDKTIYVRQITSCYVVICKKTVCYLYNIQKYSSDKIIYLKSIIKLLNNKKSFKGITKNDLDINDDYFSNCKVFSKREFGLCYNDFIFLVSVPEGCIVTYFDVSKSISITNLENSKKYMKRMNIFINIKKEMKKYYFIWYENSNLVKIFTKTDKKIDINDKFIIPNSNNSEMHERHNLIVINNKEELISFDKEIKLNNDKIIFSIKQCANSDIIIITKNNEMIVYNFLCNSIITIVTYAKIILDDEIYFLKRIGKGLYIVNLADDMLGLIELKTGKILKKFSIDGKLCNYADIVQEGEENKNKLNKNILILNSYNIFSLDL